MYFERLVIDRATGRVTEGVVAEEDVWSGGRLLTEALGRDDHAWIIAVLSRAVPNVDESGPGALWRLEGAFAGGAVAYTFFRDDDEGRALSSREELDEVLSAIAGLVEIL